MFSMKLYAARHGQTDWNVAGKVCGRTDVDLTETGVEQAKELGERIKSKGIHIDVIIASPLKRAQKTAKIAREIFAERDAVPEIITDERLIEQDYGIFEGTDHRGEGFLANKRNFACRYPGGESMMMVAQRTYNLIDEVKEKYRDKTVLFVCHGGVLRVINTYFNDINNEDFFNWLADNASLYEYDL